MTTRLLGRPSNGLALLLLLLVCGSTLADDKCRTGCQGSTPNLFKYIPGTTYKYNLEGEVDFELSSAEGQLSSTKIKATVLLSQLPDCNQVLRVQNFQVIGPDAKKYGSITDVEKPIRLNFHDGHIEDVICAEPGDSQDSLNIKRAIASLFQSAVHSGYETDVFGTCPTESSQHKEGNILSIQKSRRLNRCSHRESVKNDFISTAFNLNSELKSSPLLNSQYTSEQRVKNGIMDHVLVTETYNFLPFQIGKSGAKATVQTKLSFAGTSKDAPKPKVSEGRTIIFENPHPVHATKINVAAILTAVKDTAKTIGDTVSDNTANKFSNLIRIVSVAKKDDLLTVYNQVKSGAGFADKTVGKKVFLDALFRAGSGDAVEVAIELFKSKQLDPVEQKLVFLGLAFVKHATPNSLASAATLLDQPNLPREAYLSIGTLAGRYCSAHKCDKLDQLDKLTNKLLSKLGDGKTANRQQENDVISILKALTNMKHLTDAVVPKLVAIAQDKKAPVRVRVAALEAYMADACKDKLRDSAISILKDIQQDAEIRIKAYLVMAQCPNGKVANTLKTMLDNEPSYQVGGFIVTHLRNIRASANPDKELAKQQLALVNTMKKFPMDPRRFSFNNEFSYMINSIGLSNSVESNVIYSQNSYLPRSASLNLTSEIFGHTLNFFELDARQENLDRLIEHYLGPLGLFRNKKPEEMFASGKESMDKVTEHIKERFMKSRSKRDIGKEIDTIGKQVQIKTNELNNDLDLDLSVKLFGSEMLFLSINEETQKLTPNAIIDKIFDKLDSGIENAKKFEHTIRNNLRFLDFEVSYPTSMGFPLRLSVEGSSSVQLKAAGSIDIKAILSNSKDHIMKLSLIPSASVEINARLTMDTQHVDSGLKFTPTLHTATGGAAEIEFFNSGKGVDVKFSLPVEKQQLVSVNYDIVFNTRELGVPEVNTPIKFSQNKDFSICLDQVSPLIGVTFCAELNGPNPSTDGHVIPWALAGNSKFAVSIEKEAEYEVSEYHYRNVLHLEPGKHGVELILETKGKNIVSFKVDAFVSPDKFIKASLESPIKKATLEGRITDTKQEKSASLEFEHDGFKYSGKVGVAISGGGGKSIYKPLIEYRTPEQKNAQSPPYTVQGQIIAEETGEDFKYTFDNVQVIIPNEKPFTIAGYAGRESGSYVTDLTVGNGADTASLKGRFQSKADLVKFNAEFQNTLNPMMNFNVKYELKHQADQCENTLQLTHGDLSSKTNVLKLHNLFSKKGKKIDDYEVNTKNSFSYPLLGVEAKFDFDSTPKTVDYDLDIKYNNIKLGSELDLKYNQKQRGDYEFEFDLYGFENKLALKAKRDITGEKSKIDNSLEVNGKKMEVTGLLTHHIKPQDLDIGADLTIKVPTRNDPIKWSNSLKVNPNELDTYIKISSGNIAYIDAFLKANKDRDINGSVKINLENVITANGQLTAVKGVGNANIIIDFIKAGRKIKAESKYHVAAPTVNVMFVIHPNFEKDATKFSFNTENQVTAESITSKNLVNCCDKNLELNFKGQRTGNWFDGTQSGEGELTLPCDMFFTGKFNRDIHVVNGVANGKVFANFEQRDNKSAPGRKIVYKAAIKDTNFKESIFDMTYDVEIEGSNGQKLNTDLYVKRQKEGEKYVAESKYKLTTTFLKNPVEITTAATYLHRVGDYHITSSYGPANTFDLKGTYDSAGGDKPIKGDFDMVIKSENPKVKIIKLNGGGSVLKPDGTGKSLEMSGKAGIFIDDDGSTKDATVDISGEGELKLGHDNGQAKGTLKFQKEDPISVSMGYDVKEQDHDAHVKGNFDLQYAANKNINADIVLEKKALVYTVDLKIKSPEKIKDLRIQINSKRSDDNQHRNGEIIITADGKVYTMTNEVVFSEDAPKFSFELKHPDGKKDIFAAKVSKISPKNIGAEIKVVNVHKDFTFDGTFEAHIEKVEDFNVKLTADSPKLKLDKIVIEAKSEAGKKISFSATTAGKNMVAGATTYKVREEGGKYIVEGSGNFKVKDQDQTGNFKYSRQMLTLEKNSEQGLEISFDAGLGSRAIDSELKVTNKQFRILNSYCEEKKQCAHFEIDSKTSTADVANYNHELEVNVDLRKLGLLHEFGLKAVTTRKQFMLDHTVDIHFQSEDNKYQYSLYLHPKEGGVSITTPQRIVSLESKIVPFTEANNQFSGEISLYLNKKADPTKKTSLSAIVKRTGDDKVVTGEGEIKFTSPGLSKPLSISFKNHIDVPARKYEYNTIVDVFSAPNQKLESNIKADIIFDKESGKYGYSADITVKSAGMNVDINYHESIIYTRPTHEYKANAILNYNVAGNKCQCLAKWETTPTSAVALLKLMDREWFSSKSKMQLSKESQVIDSETSIYGLPARVSHFELKNYNSLNWVWYKKATPNNKLTLHAAFIPGQIADLRATVEKGGKHELLHASIKLDEKNFLKSDYGFSLDNVQKMVLDPIRTEAIPAIVKEGRVFADDFTKKSIEHAQKIGEVAKKNAPNMTPAVDYYKGEANKIKAEITADKTIQEMAEFMKNIFGSVVEVFNDLLSRIIKITDQFGQLIRANVTKFTEIFEKDVVPKMKEIIDKITKEVGKGFETVSNLVFAVIAKASEFLDAHQAELKQLATSLSGIGQDVGRLVMINYEKARELIVQNFNRLYEELKALPIYEELKNKYDAFGEYFGELSEPTIGAIQELANALKELLPNDDLKKIITDVTEYIIKKIKMEKVNDIEALETLIHDIIIAVRKLLQQINIHELQLSEKDLFGVNIFYDLPKLVAAKFSPLAYLQQGEFPSWRDMLYSVSFNPRQWIPPLRMYAILMQGTQVFTFDGKHIMFPGKCNYLLVRDAVDGNFSVVGSFSNGVITGITLADGVDNVMVKKDGHVLVNNAATEFPVMQGHIVAYRLNNIFVLKSKSGVNVECTTDLSGCIVSVNGFYHGKLRGLMGNGNSEPYDDFTLPNGKIVTSESDFTNAYKTTPSCAAIKTVDHSAIQHSPDCTKYFGSDSSLRLGFPFIAPDNFRSACDHAVAAGLKDAVQNSVLGYVAALYTRKVPVRVPSEFVQCTNFEKPTKIGDHFTVKLPGKAADVILAVDRAKINEPLYKDLMQPLITQLTQEFNTNGITDIEFHLITYGGDFLEWPAHNTQGGKMTWHGKAPTIKFVDPPTEKTISTGCPKLDRFFEELRNVKDDLDLATGNNAQSKAFISAIDYPFRAQAVKTMIALTSSPCPTGKLIALQKLRTQIFKTDHLTVNVITPIPSFKVKDAKTTKNVIGFNEHHVFTFTDSKKKPEGGSELHKDLEYEDYCLDWTVKHRGNVFVAENFQQSKGPARKQFLQVMAHNIVDQLTNLEQTMDCECKMTNQFDGSNICRLAHSEPKASKKSGKKKK